MLKLRKTKLTKLEQLKDGNSQDVIDVAKIAELGLPYGTTIFTYDPTLKLMAIGSKYGVVKVVGNSGVELGLDLGSDLDIKLIYFLKINLGLIIIYTYYGGYIMEIYRFTNIDTTTSLVLDGKKKFDNSMRITTCKVSHNEKHMHIGTISGNIYTFDLEHMEFTTITIKQDDIFKEAVKPLHYSLGAVESITSPSDLDEIQLLIGYRRGTLILWDIETAHAINFFTVGSELESVFWHPSGKMFLTSHTEGTIIHWTLFNDKNNIINANTITSKNNKYKSTYQQSNNQFSVSTVVPYGPANCKPIHQVFWYGSLFLFSNGTPYNSESDSNTITLMAGGTFLHIYTFTSPIIKFDVITRGKNSCNGSNACDKSIHWDCFPTHLIVLTEQELVVVPVDRKYTCQRQIIDKTDIVSNSSTSTNNYNLFPLHFPCIQFSNITCLKIVDNCSDNFINNLMVHGKTYGYYDEYGWPISGGFPKLSYIQRNDILITGHENGDILFWWTRPQTTYKLLTRFSTSFYYHESTILDIDQESIQNGSFQNAYTICDKSNVGFFQINCDDQRFHVRKIDVSTQNNILYIGGNAGNVIIINLDKNKNYNYDFKTIECNLVENYPQFKWHGETCLTLKDDITNVSNRNFHPIQHITINPPAPISCLAQCSDAGFLVCGTCHGYFVYDCITQTSIYCKNTSNPKYMITDGHNIHRRSFIRTLRNSFRRLGTSKNQKKNNAKFPNASVAFTRVGGGSVRKPSKLTSGPIKSEANQLNPSTTTKNIQKSINIDSIIKQDETMSGYVSVCKIFYGAFKSQFQTNLALLIGTQSGKIYINMLSYEHDLEKRQLKSLCCENTKEIILRHKAYVVDFILIDHHLEMVEPKYLSENKLQSDENKVLHHSLIIVTEEQIKMVCLPSLKPKYKLKLTALNGGRIRKCAYIKTSSNVWSNDFKNYLICITNWGQLLIINPSNVTILKTIQLVNSYDYRAINSVNFSTLGYGYYLCSPTEFRRFSISKAEKLFLSCYIATNKEKYNYLVARKKDDAETYIGNNQLKLNHYYDLNLPINNQNSSKTINLDHISNQFGVT